MANAFGTSDMFGLGSDIHAVQWLITSVISPTSQQLEERGSDPLASLLHRYLEYRLIDENQRILTVLAKEETRIKRVLLVMGSEGCLEIPYHDGMTSSPGYPREPLQYQPLYGEFGQETIGALLPSAVTVPRSPRLHGDRPTLGS
ncbi:hypothetical protein FRB96_009400 [Tulasnella sp. 330]|nr:hypothetical protein FRB96_009400 [Tulasnella sp. 330]